MSTGKLFISFWNICLENLPEGTFARSRLTPDEAKLSIEQAREKGVLVCLSQDDVLAPYRKREHDNHAALCRVLDEHFGIRLSLKDFCIEYENDGERSYSVNPLNCFGLKEPTG